MNHTVNSTTEGNADAMLGGGSATVTLEQGVSIAPASVDTSQNEGDSQNGAVKSATKPAKTVL